MQIRRPLLLPFFGFLLLAAPSAAYAQIDVGVSVQIAPPILPIYAQPPLPELGYIWTPGYWAYGDTGYFWVPGTWVEPPQVGFLWTPGYWAWGNGGYLWNAGYWGPTVGYYGGINYGYGYGGNGYAGGRWDHGHFDYNRSANNLRGVQVTNSYSRPVPGNGRPGRAAFNGGTGGTTARPSPGQEAAARAAHTQPTALQAQHEQAARGNPALRASTNHGRPAIAATQKPGVMEGPGVVPTRGAATRPANARPPGTAAGQPSRTPGTAAAPRTPGTPPASAARPAERGTPGTAEAPRTPAAAARPPAAAARPAERGTPGAAAAPRPPTAAARPPHRSRPRRGPPPRPRSPRRRSPPLHRRATKNTTNESGAPARGAVHAPIRLCQRSEALSG
jgi:hypothetical protein